MSTVIADEYLLLDDEGFLLLDDGGFLIIDQVEENTFGSPLRQWPGRPIPKWFFFLDELLRDEEEVLMVSEMDDG